MQQRKTQCTGHRSRRRGWALPLFIAAAAVLLLAGGARAQGAPPAARPKAAQQSGAQAQEPAQDRAQDRARSAEHARKGVACYEELNYGCARTELEAALALAGSVRLHQYLAYTLIALGEEKAAAEQFVRAFELDEGFRLSPRNVSPKIYRIYRIARRRYEVRREVEQRNLLTQSRRTIDEFFSGLVEPIQERGTSWLAVDLDGRLYLELLTGFSVLAGDNLGGVSDAFEGGVTFGAQVLYGLNENLAVGPVVRYSTHPTRKSVPGLDSLDFLQVGAQVRLQEFTEVFLFYLALSGGVALTGDDSVNDRTGWYVSPMAGVHAIVTNNLSLGVTGGLSVIRNAGVPSQETTFEIPILFELSYMY